MARGLLKFGQYGHDAATKVDLRKDYEHFVPLNEIARWLPLAMEKKSMTSIAGEFRDALPASYRSTTTITTTTVNSNTTAPGSLAQPPSQPTLGYPQVLGKQQSLPEMAYKSQSKQRREPLGEIMGIIRHLPTSAEKSLNRASGLMVPSDKYQQDGKLSWYWVPIWDAHSLTPIRSVATQPSKTLFRSPVRRWETWSGDVHWKIVAKWLRMRRRWQGDLFGLWSWFIRMSLPVLTVMTSFFWSHCSFPSYAEEVLKRLKQVGKPKALPEIEGHSVTILVPPSTAHSWQNFGANNGFSRVAKSPR